MHITVIGTGYVGLVMGVCLASTGHRVTCLDINRAKIDLLNSGGCPIYEPGLTDLIERHRTRLSFKALDEYPDSDVVVVAVGTPSGEDGSADLSALWSVATFLEQHEPRPVVIKSTVPVGTAETVENILGTRFEVISNPEFMREGTAIEDFLHPDRIVAGARSHLGRKVIETIYRGIDAPLFFMGNESAELVKYAANCLLAVKISYANEIANLCERVGADIIDVVGATGADKRIGTAFLGAGVGYGGSCFPKDVRALIHMGQEADANASIVEAANKANEYQKLILPCRVAERFPRLEGTKIALWGLAFKPGTDDVRESSAMVAVRYLRARGATVVAYDPQATADVDQVTERHEALKDADALLLFTEWSEFRIVDWSKVKGLMRTAVVFDGRNLWDPETVRNHGFEYYGIGRSGGGVERLGGRGRGSVRTGSEPRNLPVC